MRTERVDACAGGLSSRLCCLQAQGETQPAVKVQQRTSSVLARRTLVEKSGSVHTRLHSVHSARTMNSEYAATKPPRPRVVLALARHTVHRYISGIVVMSDNDNRQVGVILYA